MKSKYSENAMKHFNNSGNSKYSTPAGSPPTDLLRRLPILRWLRLPFSILLDHNHHGRWQKCLLRRSCRDCHCLCAYDKRSYLGIRPKRPSVPSPSLCHIQGTLARSSTGWDVLAPFREIHHAALSKDLPRCGSIQRITAQGQG